MSETQAIVRLVANNNEVAKHVMFYLDGKTRPDFEDEVPETEHAVFEGLEFAETPVDVKCIGNNVIDAWFENIDLSDLEEILAAFDPFQLKGRYVFFADDEEYKAYFTYEKGKLRPLYTLEDDEELDARLWDLDWDVEALELIIARAGGI